MDVAAVGSAPASLRQARRAAFGDFSYPRVVEARRSWVRARGDLIAFLLALAIACSTAFILERSSRLTFIYDDWDLLVNRQSWSPGSFLDPYNEHIVLGPVIVFKFLVTTFGMNSAVPFRMAGLLLFMASAVLLFLWLRRRVGDWGALIGACLIVFLGASFENLLWPVQVAYFGSVAGGLGMLIALDRDDRLGDRVACGLLIVSMAFSSLGFAFLAGAIVELGLNRRSKLERLYVIALPAALTFLWWAGWAIPRKARCFP